MENWFSRRNDLTNVFCNYGHFLYKICGHNMKTLNIILLDLIRPNNNSIGGVFLKYLKYFLVILMQFQNRYTLSIPSIQLHCLVLIINLVLNKVQFFCFKGIIYACLILCDQLPVCHRSGKLEWKLWVSLVWWGTSASGKCS